MGNFKVVRVFLFILVGFSLLTGCFDRGANSETFLNQRSEPLTNVRFVIEGQQPAGSIRAQTAEPPRVVFELKLLDRANFSNPVVIYRKLGQVVAGATGYSASAVFEDVPALPAIGSMTIEGGYLTAPDSVNYRNWVGRADLVAASENTITLVGSGNKSATDVAVNLLDQLIAIPANVATLAVPIFAKVDAIIAGLNLTSSTIYADALEAYNDAYAPPPVPADAEFTPPVAWSTLAYPKKDASVSVLMNSFNSDSEAWVLLMNRSTGSLTPGWSVPQTLSGSIRAAVAPRLSHTGRVARQLSAAEHQFHLSLRNFTKPAGSTAFAPASLRPAVRAVVLNDVINFNINHTTSLFTSVAAKCMRIADVDGRKTFFFLDTGDEGMTGISTILDGVVDLWKRIGGIYATNRSIFGSEPPGTLNSANVNDFGATDLYILISRQVFTAGYFYSGDLYPITTVAQSNHKKIFYLQLPSDTSDSTRTVNDLAATSAHEFQHMIFFWQKRALASADPWLEEAMSGYAEHINGFRIENTRNQSKALQANEYFARINQIRVDKWHLNTDSNDVINAHYGKGFLFGVWLAQNYGTSGSVQNLLTAQLNERAAVESFTGEAFDRTFAKFLLAMAVNDSINGGVYGIKGLDLDAEYSFGEGWAPVTLTGPNRFTIDPATAGASASPVVSPYAAAFIRIASGNGGNVTVNATLPAGMSLFQLRRN